MLQYNEPKLGWDNIPQPLGSSAMLPAEHDCGRSGFEEPKQAANLLGKRGRLRSAGDRVNSSAHLSVELNAALPLQDLRMPPLHSLQWCA